MGAFFFSHGKVIFMSKDILVFLRDQIFCASVFLIYNSLKEQNETIFNASLLNLVID